MSPQGYTTYCSLISNGMRPDAIRAVIGFLKRLALVEIAAVAIYLFIASLGYYAQWYRDIGLGEVISFQVAQAIFIFCVQSLMIALLFWRWRRRLNEPASHDLVLAPEHERLERKSTLRWDLATGKVNKALEKAAMKTVAAFLNTTGGHLVLGVGDNQTILGIEHDCATLVRKDADGFETHFNNLFHAMLGAHVRHAVQLQPVAIQGKECMLVTVAPSPQPVYLSDEGKEEFFVRTGNSTTSLKLSEAQAYINARWRAKR